MHGWIGQANREIDTTPVLHFRKALQALGLVRKHKGSLLLTRADTICAPRGRPYGTNWRTASSRTPTGSTPMRRCCCFSTRQRPPTASFRSTRSRQRAHPPTRAEWHTDRRLRPTGCALLMVLRNVSTAHVSRSDHWRIDDEVVIGAQAWRRQRDRREQIAGDGDEFPGGAQFGAAMFRLGPSPALSTASLRRSRTGALSNAAAGRSQEGVIPWCHDENYQRLADDPHDDQKSWRSRQISRIDREVCAQRGGRATA